MPAVSNVTVYDGTGVDKTFKPVSNRQLGELESVFALKGAGQALSAAQLTFRTRQTKSETGVNRLVLGISVPHVVTVDGVLKVVHTDRAELTMMLPAQGTDAERTYLIALIKGLLNAGNFSDWVQDSSHFI